MTVISRNPLFGTDWDPLLRQEFTKPYWADLQAFIEDERSPVYPPHDEIFKAFELTAYAETKVVILGQDPYPGPNQAHGLAFSVQCGVPVPPSLRNIHGELHEDQQVPIPDHGNLEAWARHGVLLLNATLTVRAGFPRSHRGRGWEMFTDEVIRVVNRNTDRVVFILWGDEARKKRELIDTPRHVTICSAHPSPRSARKGFFGSRPFTRANDALIAASREAVDWALPIKC